MQILVVMHWSQMETRNLGENTPIEQRSNVNTDTVIDRIE